MKLDDLRCVNENVNMDDYYKLYNYVRENMEHPEWLGLIPREEACEILKNGGKIWLYYDKDELVCSVFYMPVKEKTLRKHNIETEENETGSLGPIMVSPQYVGNGLMIQMMNVFNEYNNDINNKYVFTKVSTENIFSVRNIEKDGYQVTDVWENERGSNTAYLKEL